MPKLNSDLKDYFTIEEKVKIKNIQYLVISIALLFVLLKRYFYELSKGVGRGGQGRAVAH